MAGFRTHLSVAAGIGTAGTGYGLYLGLWPLSHSPALVLLSALGGIMPDIDADKSHSVRLIFTVLAVTAAFASLSVGRAYFSTLGTACLALTLYIAVRDALAAIFRFTTRHRASWHSLLAIVGVATATVVASFQLFDQSVRLAWIDGLAMALGMLVHLLLDELFSFDLEGARIKRSFGTALKLFDYRRPIATALMALAVFATGLGLPPWPSRDLFVPDHSPYRVMNAYNQSR